MVGPDGNQIGLCLNCFTQYQAVTSQVIAEQERHTNHLLDQAEIIGGIPGIFPRYPERRSVVIEGGVTLNNINVNGGQIGVLNTGIISNVDSTITILNQQGNTELADVIKQLTEAIIINGEMKKETKDETLEAVQTLAQEALAPKEKQKKGVVKALLTHIAGALSGIATMEGIWMKAKLILEKGFGL